MRAEDEIGLTGSIDLLPVGTTTLGTADDLPEAVWALKSPEIHTGKMRRTIKE